jgi:2-polyprenyl-3-methyl-5-hydroxy-6-metoxy-1,4-benzoquinol methylase
MPNTVAEYGWHSQVGPESCGYIAPEVLRVVAKLGSRRVLDLGSGNGALCGQLARTGVQVVGAELDARGVEIARLAHPAIPFYQFGVEDDPADFMRRERPFDAVVSTEVIEHLYSPHRLPSFAAAVTRPGGYLIVSTPYHGYVKNVAIALLNRWDHHHTVLWHGGHIKFFSRRTLTQLVEGNGFNAIAFSGVGRVPWLWKSMIFVAQKRR